MAASFPDKIDRFEIRKILGQGSQGVVYLADDPELKRQVAIKSVKLNGRLADSANVDQLLAEARTVSKLQHANIVSIFDIGVQNEEPYLVLEFINGESLQQRIGEPIDLNQKLGIMRDILAGASAAHDLDIVHCDIKPANILIGRDGKAKIADFGLAFLTEDAANNDDLYGTPQYMAPEYIDSRRHQKVSDVFSIGLVCYELLTGQPAFRGEDLMGLLHAIGNTLPERPSALNDSIDQRLESLIMKSLEKDPVKRYADGEEMARALNDYLALGEAQPAPKSSDATVGFLLRRMRHQKDFPVFSQTISTLNQATTSETDSLTSVSNAILKDVALTNKVLRLVNSAHYNRGGGKVSTISRAVVMLGLNPVRSIAAGLMLFEHMQNKMQASQLKEHAVEALFSGLLANSLANSLKFPNHEEAFLCALLQQLGKMLVEFYLHDEAQAIDKYLLQHGCSEDTAVTQVLGISYARLGIAVAGEWGFPRLITDSLKPLDFENLPESESAGARMHLVAQFGSALGATMNLPPERQTTAISRLCEQFGKVLPIEEEQVAELLQSCHQELAEFARLIQFDLSKSRYYQQISSAGDAAPEAPINPTQAREFGATDKVEILEEQAGVDTESAERALTDGIQDITNTLTGDYTINQVMQMILETIYRAMPGTRVVLCLKDRATGTIKARFGYGEDVDRIVKRFAVSLCDKGDVFHVAFTNNVDIRIEDSRDDKISARIPGWYHRDIAARSFTIFPIIIKQAPVALIYIDSPGETPIQINDKQLGLLKTLRNQAILAIKNLN